MRGARKALTLPPPATTDGAGSQDAHSCPDFTCTSNPVCQKLARQLCPLIYQGDMALERIMFSKEYFTFLSSHSYVPGDVSRGSKQNKNTYSPPYSQGGFLICKSDPLTSLQQLLAVLRIKFKMLNRPYWP